MAGQCAAIARYGATHSFSVTAYSGDNPDLPAGEYRGYLHLAAESPTGGVSVPVAVRIWLSKGGSIWEH